MSEFDTSLNIGKQREAELIAFFQSLGHKPIAIPGKFTGFDFFLANTKEAYEVKQDWKAHYSGNLVVEIEMYGKPSGLMGTTADWWIFDTKSEFESSQEMFFLRGVLAVVILPFYVFQYVALYRYGFKAAEIWS